MQIIAAPDSFKGSLTAAAAAAAIKSGALKACPSCQVKEIPIADGGEGTLDVLLAAREGVRHCRKVADPLGRPTEACFATFDGDRLAVIEMAQASGLLLLKPEERDPWLTGTYGTGELIKVALDLGCEEIIITIGGSATVDGGLGMLAALGVKFYDSAGGELPPVGGSLLRLDRIDPGYLDPRLKHCRITVASDVTNPLLGPQGAAAVFGPQKGATPQQVELLDAGLKRFSTLTADLWDQDLITSPGAGAAGGLGFALMAYLQGEMRPGIDVVLDTLEIDRYLAEADLVITGEGRLDGQTAQGKAPLGLARRAQAHACPVLALTGSLGPGYEAVYAAGIAGVFPILTEPMLLKEAMDKAAILLEDAAYRIVKLFSALGADLIKSGDGGKSL